MDIDKSEKKENSKRKYNFRESTKEKVKSKKVKKLRTDSESIVFGIRNDGITSEIQAKNR